MTLVEVKTAELIGPALDWAVAKAIGWKEPIYGVGAIYYIAQDNFLSMEKPDPDEPDDVTAPHHFNHYEQWSPSRIWNQGGVLIEKYKPDLQTTSGGEFAAYLNNDTACPDPLIFENGPTYLVALCRAIVAAKIGDVVSVPAELVGGGV